MLWAKPPNILVTHLKTFLISHNLHFFGPNSDPNKTYLNKSKQKVGLGLKFNIILLFSKVPRQKSNRRQIVLFGFSKQAITCYYQSYHSKEVHSPFKCLNQRYNTRSCRPIFTLHHFLMQRSCKYQLLKYLVQLRQGTEPITRRILNHAMVFLRVKCP